MRCTRMALQSLRIGAIVSHQQQDAAKEALLNTARPMTGNSLIDIHESVFKLILVHAHSTKLSITSSSARDPKAKLALTLPPMTMEAHEKVVGELVWGMC
ncbi:hypothetical protein FPOAC2_03638 [Fusarium poae]|jgi:hypothetical protein